MKSGIFCRKQSKSLFRISLEQAFSLFDLLFSYFIIFFKSGYSSEYFIICVVNYRLSKIITCRIISYHVFFQMLMKRKNLDRHIMDVWILIQLMINHQKWEFDFSKNIKITNVTRNLYQKKFSSSFFSNKFFYYI